MSQQRSRSTLHSRPSTLGRRDAYYGEKYYMNSGQWKNPENADNRNAESSKCWDNGSSQTEEQVDHWAKFIEAIGRAEKQKTASMSRCHTQVGIEDIRQDSSHSPRQPHRERLSSWEGLHHSMGSHQRIQSPGQRRNVHDAYVDRHHSRNSSPRYLRGKSHERMEHGVQSKVHEDRCERSSYRERSLKSNYMEPHLHLKPYEDIVPHDEYTVSHRGFRPHTAPVIVEHDHGIPNHDSRSRNPGREREQRDLARECGDPRKHSSSKSRERPRSREPVRDQEHPRFSDPVSAREHSRGHDPVSHCGHPEHHDAFRDLEFPVISGQEHPRSRDLPRDRDFKRSREYQRGGDPNRRRETSRNTELQHYERDYNLQPATFHDCHSGLNCRTRGDTGLHSSSYESWKEEMHPRQNALDGSPQFRNANHPGAIMDFASYETLKIKVDMNRPVGQSSHLGYSSERQLSLDLVNVGRQRLDFLPMLEHSGTFTETAIHSGTFAQEIITLVHHVKENYFQGQGIPLHERFSNKVDYSFMDEYVEDEQEKAGNGPVVNRPRGSTSSDTQIFCKIGTLQKPHIPAPGDLRHDLERKRQERLEGVKITIAGKNVSQMPPQSQDVESVFADDEDHCKAGWSNNEPNQPEHWIKTIRKRPALNSNSRWHYKRARHRQGAHLNWNENNGTQW